MAREPPGARAICALHRLAAMAETSMRYSRPLIVSSKRCTFTEGVILRVAFGARKRKKARRRIHMQQRARMWAALRKNNQLVSECPQAFHCPSTCFPQGGFAAC